MEDIKDNKDKDKDKFGKDIEENEIEEIEEPTEYDESTWGKKVDGQFVIDGYKFKGREAFRKSKEYLENLLVRGAKGEINGSKYKALDSRLKGIEREVDLQIVENSKTGIENRGAAIVKLYGPNKRKENSVTVTKSKKSDVKFVTIIAQKIIRPLIKQSLAVQNEMNCLTNQETVIKCELCDKTFNTIRGLKGHQTKVHKGQKNYPRPADLSDESETDEDCDVKDISKIKAEKKYYSKCTECNHEIETKRKYELIQLSLKHKDVCKKVNRDCKETHSKGTCNVCGFVAKSEPNIKRHMRDKHDITSVSTSPPPKKTKVIVQEVSEEEMEIDTNEITDNANKEHKNMEIDNIEEQRSKKMDQKVIAKAKKVEEEDRVFNNKRKLKEIRDKEHEELEIEKQKILTKQKKQKRKDEKKKLKNRSIKADKVDHNRMPNIRPIPRNISHLVNEGDVIYTVPGDGSCGPSSASAFLFKDEVFGTQLKRKTNKFLAKHWEKKYKFKCQCSEVSPFVREVGRGKIVTFTDPEKLKEYLNESEEAVYMWSDSEDFAVIADMYQVKIKIITTNGPTDENPIVNWILPDEDMKEHAELKDVELDEMVLFHENDMHFNLIVSEKDDLVKMGSLSFRTNVGPYMKNNTNDEIETEKNKSNNDSTEKEIKTLKAELKQLKEKLIFLEKDYLDCGNELKVKTEEVEKLKIQVKTQKEMKVLEQKAKEDKETRVANSCDKRSSADDTGKAMQEHTIKAHTDDKWLICTECSSEASSINELVEHIIRYHGLHMMSNIKCSKCGFKCATESQLSEHIEIKHSKQLQFICGSCEFKGKSDDQIKEHIRSEHPNDTKYECYKCEYQGGDESDLKNHLTSTHDTDEEHNCSKCCFQGTSSNELKKHIIIKHMINCTECEFYCDNKRNFETHKLLIHANKNPIRCRICGETLQSKADLMNHRKTEHIETVAICKNIIKDGYCTFSNQGCWWNHQKQPENEIRIEGSLKCYTCNETFNARATLMVHKKEKHRHLVRGCNLFIDDKCPYNDSKCWFIHEETFVQGDNKEEEEKEEQETNKSVFQNVQENLEPPIKSNKNIKTKL